MKQRINKITVIFIILLFALSSISIAYAAWTDTIMIDGDIDTGELKWELIYGPHGSSHGTGPDWNCFFTLEDYNIGLAPEGKDVADTIVEIDNTVTHPHTMTVTIENAYPYYYDHITYKVHCYGDIPLKIWKVNFIVNGVIVKTLTEDNYWAERYVYLDLTGEGDPDVEVWWGNPLNGVEQLHYCYDLDRSFEILVLQPAPMNSELSFTIEYVAIQWNEYTSDGSIIGCIP
jgi:hypothetical protein